nr:hypothetical protein [uncultured Sulfurimonas sp.]
MKKLLIIFLLLTTSVFAESFYTLDKVKDLRMYMSLNADFLSVEQRKSIEESATSKLKKAGFVFGKTDAAIFMINVESVEVEESHAIYIQVGLGEEVLTPRSPKVYSFAFTYLANDFVDSDEPYTDTLESVNFLVSQFIESHKEDNE